MCTWNSGITQRAVSSVEKIIGGHDVARGSRHVAMFNRYPLGTSRTPASVSTSATASGSGTAAFLPFADAPTIRT